MRIIKDNSNYKDEYILQYEWPEDCFIQGGSNGLVISKTKNYNTHFIEAFPKNPKCFIRGEGETFKDAETKAYEKYMRFSSCKKHEFEKVSGFFNGMGKCKHCGLMQIVFIPDYKCIKCGKPDNFTSIKSKYKKNEFDCMCEECASKKENFDFLDIYYFQTQQNIRGLFKCDIEKTTFDEISKYIEEDSLKLTSEELYKILSKDQNIYLLEYLKRLELLDLDYNFKVKYLLENYSKIEENDIITINIVQYFYDNYIKTFFENGYK